MVACVMAGNRRGGMAMQKIVQKAVDREAEVTAVPGAAADAAGRDAAKVADLAISSAEGDSAAATSVAFPVLIALSAGHLLNDLMQSLVPAVYPLIKSAYGLDFAQIGMITFVFQIAACLFQPLVGMYNDKRPLPYSVVAAMGFTLAGLIVLGSAGSYPMLLLGAGLVGTGSSVFHPEATRLARNASGGQLGLAQSLFQVGGRAGAAIGPLLAAFVVAPNGQRSLVWLSGLALLAMLVLFQCVRWSAEIVIAPPKAAAAVNPSSAGTTTPIVSASVAVPVAILLALIFSKDAYSASFGSFYTFYLMDQFKLPVQTSQMLLFLFLLAGTLGTLIGGPIGDRIGRRKIIWVSILGALPFTLLLPHVNLFWTVVLTMMIAAIMASAFGAILVYAMELLPGRVGLIAGLFYGLSFGFAGISAALLGRLADATSIATVYHVCAFLPAIGLLAWFLPDVGRERR
jgi:MFS transporter, FSR family, fosmidomycin resistance protein